MPNVFPKHPYVVATCKATEGPFYLGATSSVNMSANDAETIIWLHRMATEHARLLRAYRWKTGGTVTNGANLAMKIGLYQIDSATMRPSLLIPGTSVEITHASGTYPVATNTWFEKALAQPILVEPQDLAVGILLPTGGFGTQGDIISLQNYRHPMANYSTDGDVDLYVTRAVAFSYAGGLPADFGAEAGLTWTATNASQGSQIATWLCWNRIGG